MEWYLNAVEVGDALELKCQYDRELFAEPTVAAWLVSFERVLQELVIDTSREVLQIANLNSGRRPPVEAVYALTSNQPEAVEIAHELITYVAPRSETEKILTKIWKEVLRTENVGIHDDFFELGGQSLSAVSVTNKIEAVLKTRLPLASLLEAPTIQQLARLLDEKRSKHSWSSLVSLERSGDKRPVFLFHSHGGNVLEYHPLARRLGKDRPVYALQSRGLDGSNIEEPRVEEMAAYYLEEIRSVQPHGPYYLGGYCLGGIVALEAARRLEESGELVELVFMINSATAKYVELPLETGWSRRHYYLGRQRLALEWNNLSNRLLGQRAAYVSARAKRVTEVCQARSAMLWETLMHRKNGHAFHRSLTYHLEQLAMAYDRAWKVYEPKPYNGRVLHVYAERQPLGIRPDPSLGWSGYLGGGYTVRTIPGFRQNLLDEPAVDLVAEFVQNALEECEKLSSSCDPQIEPSYNLTVSLADPGVLSNSSKSSSRET